MDRTIKLNEQHYQAAAASAEALGKTPVKYIEWLIETANESFDEILEPVRKQFAAGSVTEEELDDAVNEARAAHARANPKSGLRP